MTGLIFTTEKGAPLDTRNVTRYLQRHLVRLGSPTSVSMTCGTPSRL